MILQNGKKLAQLTKCKIKKAKLVKREKTNWRE